MRGVEAEIEALTVDQLLDLLEKADQAIRPAFAIDAFAGIRDSEIKKLQWSDIDLETGIIYARGVNAKSAKSRHVEVSDNLRKWIEPMIKKSGPVWPKIGRALHDQTKLKAGFSNPETITEKQKEERSDLATMAENRIAAFLCVIPLGFSQRRSQPCVEYGASV